MGNENILCACRLYHQWLIYVAEDLIWNIEIKQIKWYWVMNFHQHVLVKESELFSFIVEKFFDFDDLRSLEKALSGTELHQKLLLLTKKY